MDGVPCTLLTLLLSYLRPLGHVPVGQAAFLLARLLAVWPLCEGGTGGRERGEGSTYLRPLGHVPVGQAAFLFARLLAVWTLCGVTVIIGHDREAATQLLHTHHLPSDGTGATRHGTLQETA